MDVGSALTTAILAAAKQRKNQTILTLAIKQVQANLDPYVLSLDNKGHRAKIKENVQSLLSLYEDIFVTQDIEYIEPAKQE